MSEVDQGEGKGEEHQGGCLWNGRRPSTSPARELFSSSPGVDGMAAETVAAPLMFADGDLFLLLRISGTHGITHPMPRTITGSRSGTDLSAAPPGTQAAAASVAAHPPPPAAATPATLAVEVQQPKVAGRKQK